MRDNKWFWIAMSCLISWAIILIWAVNTISACIKSQ